MWLTIGGLKRLSQYIGGQLASAVAFTGGTIDGTTIGGTTPATGYFTGGTIDGTTIGGTTPAAGYFGGLVAYQSAYSNSDHFMSGNVYRSVSATVSAAGTDQATATALTADINVVSTVGSGTGVLLPTPTAAGMKITVFSDGANDLAVYPHTDGTIDGAAANTAATLTSTKRADFIAVSSTAWKSAQLGVVSA